jgi:hypothetical protein
VVRRARHPRRATSRLGAATVSWCASASLAQRECGARLKETPKAQGARQPGTNRGTTPSPETTASTLADYGITKDQSAAWQWLADVPDGSA